MIVEASIPGLFRTVLIIVAIVFLVRFIGQFLIAKRNMDVEREMNSTRRQFQEQKKKASQDLGKTNILKKSARKNDIEDVDFEEID